MNLMIFNVVNLFYAFLFWPPFEYCLHYGLHFIHEPRHKLHHIIVHNNNLKNFDSFDDLEYFYFILPVLFVMDYPILFLGSSWYFSIHTLTHFKPELIPILANHHIRHHRNPNINFGITNTFYDYLFGTKI